jgi:hypothetical protein
MKELITDFKNFSTKKKLAIGVVSVVLLILVINQSSVLFGSDPPSSIAETKCKHLVKYWDGYKWDTDSGKEMKLTDFSETKELHRTSSLLVCVSRATNEGYRVRDYWDLQLEENEEGKLLYSIERLP